LNEVVEDDDDVIDPLYEFDWDELEDNKQQWISIIIDPP
jgi:hypothetical protein